MIRKPLSAKKRSTPRNPPCVNSNTSPFWNLGGNNGPECSRTTRSTAIPRSPVRAGTWPSRRVGGPPVSMSGSGSGDVTLIGAGSVWARPGCP